MWKGFLQFTTRSDGGILSTHHVSSIAHCFHTHIHLDLYLGMGEMDLRVGKMDLGMGRTDQT